MTNSLGFRDQQNKVLKKTVSVMESGGDSNTQKVVSNRFEYFSTVFFIFSIVGLGLGVSIPYSVMDNNMFKNSGLETGSFFALYFIVMGTYFVIDVLYQFLFELKFVDFFVKKYKLPIISQRFYLIALFFVYASFANLYLCILPSIENGYNIREAGFKGFILGLFSYGNLATVFGWSIKDYPFVLVFAITFSGTLFSCSSSTLTVLVASHLYNNGTIS